MQLLTVTEYERIPRREANRKFFSRLQAFDESWCSAGGEPIFDWNDRRFVRVRNYVGVIAIPGGAIEILPKIDRPDEEGRSRAQHNLLYMRSLTRRIAGEERDLAAIGRQKMPLLEQLFILFAERTLSELKRGVDHTYVPLEENLCCLKGKLLVPEHITRNAVHRQRVYCRYDDFISDTPINRVIKAACKRLLMVAKTAAAQKKLREIVFLLDEVSDLEVAGRHFNEIHYNRNAERFRPLVGFSMMVIKGMSPAWTMGQEPSFSLLFPMEQLFEEFIARYIHRFAEDFQLSRDRIHAQALGRREWLLRREQGSGAYRLKPDLVIDASSGKPQLIIDTKWKHLKSDVEDAKNGVSQADIYQLYAYAHRYDSPENVLLFPDVPGVSPKIYCVDGPFCRHRIRVEFVKLNRDLRKEGWAFREELKKVICPAF